MNEEQLRVLQRIERGALSAAEGATLLEQLDGQKASADAESSPEKPRWFRVQVSDTQTEKHKISVNIPLDLVEVGLRMGARFVPEWEPSRYAGVLEAAENGKTGLLVEELRNGELIKIFVE